MSILIDVSEDDVLSIDSIDLSDPNAAHQLLPLVYEELRKLAASRMAQEDPGQTLQPTALVHEAWIRLAGSHQKWSGQAHFFAAAAESMRRILIDKARRKSAVKRGSGLAHDELHESQIELKVPEDEILAVDEAIDLLSAEDELAAQIVKLRYFVGMTNSEIAEALGIAPRSVDRHWAYARAWLKGALEKGR
jgi:RNA polymerase sigma factor (TIGR02999 family)